MISHGDLITPSSSKVVLLILKALLCWLFSGTTGYIPQFSDTLYRKAYWNIRFPSLPWYPTQTTGGGDLFDWHFSWAFRWNTSRTATRSNPSSVIHKCNQIRIIWFEFPNIQRKDKCQDECSEPNDMCCGNNKKRIKYDRIGPLLRKI